IPPDDTCRGLSGNGASPDFAGGIRSLNPPRRSAVCTTWRMFRRFSLEFPRGAARGGGGTRLAIPCRRWPDLARISGTKIAVLARPARNRDSVWTRGQAMYELLDLVRTTIQVIWVYVCALFVVAVALMIFDRRTKRSGPEVASGLVRGRGPGGG